MFRILLAILLLIPVNGYCVTNWNKAIPAVGNSKSAWPGQVTAQWSILETLVSNYRRAETLTFKNSTTLTVSSGEVFVSNSGASLRLVLQDAGNTDITTANLDSGSSFSNSTTYYVYAATSSTTASSSTYYISLSSSAPTGPTYYFQLGSFITDGSGNVQTINNITPIPTVTVSNGSNFSSNTVYQNTSNKILNVVGNYSCTTGGGWGGMNVYGLIGSTNVPATQVSQAYFSIPGNGTCASTVNFLVPAGWYWEIIQNGSGVTNGLSGTLQRIETWNIN